MDKIADDGVQPCIVTGPEMYHRTLADIQLVDRGLLQELAVDNNTLSHLISQLFLHDLLHCLGNEIQVTLVRHLEFDLIPNVWEQRPAIVVDCLIQHKGVGKFNDPARRMLRGKVRSAKFPQRRIQITDVDNVPLGIADLDAVPDPLGLADQQIDPADQARDRCLQREAKDERDNTHRDKRRIPARRNDC
jgi:hypothetical protein